MASNDPPRDLGPTPAFTRRAWPDFVQNPPKPEAPPPRIEPAGKPTMAPSFAAVTAKEEKKAHDMTLVGR